jgi:hypothetical protein
MVPAMNRTEDPTLLSASMCILVHATPHCRPASSPILNWQIPEHCKKFLTIFPSLAGMSLTKLSLAGKNLIIPGQGEFG